MKNRLWVILVLFFGLTVQLSAQEESHLSKSQFRDSVYCVNAIPQVLEYCTYLLTTPCTSAPLDLNAALYIMDWMQHTYNYNFVFDQKFYTIVMIYPCLYNRYVAALVECAIKDDYPNNAISLQVKAISKVLDYVNNPNNEVNVVDTLDPYFNAYHNGNLETLIVSDFYH